VVQRPGTAKGEETKILWGTPGALIYSKLQKKGRDLEKS